LEYYERFREHLQKNWRLLAYQENSCLIFAVDSMPASEGKPLGWSIQRGWVNTTEEQATSRTVVPERSVTRSPSRGKPAAERRQGAGRRSAPVNRDRGSRLTVGCILDEFSAASFAPECELIPLRPVDWEKSLQERPIDLLLVESAWHGNGNLWENQIASTPKCTTDELARLVQSCKKRNVPTVFWNKEDPSHFDRFIHCAPWFDYVFTSDANMLGQYRSVLKHDRVFPLAFAAQPAIHNPIADAVRLRRVCFAGSYYAQDHDERRVDLDVLLRPALGFGLDIYDRQHGLTGPEAKAFRFPEIYRPAIRGGLTYAEMIALYKRYRVFLNVNSVKHSPTMCSRRVFELLACGTPVLSSYATAISELIGSDIVHFTESAQETKVHLDRLLHDSDHWARTSAQGIRAVLARHTYSQRWSEICQAAGLPVSARPAPTVWIIAEAKTMSQTRRVAETLTRQTCRTFRLTLLAPKSIAPRAVELLRSALPGINVEVVSQSTSSVNRLLDQEFEGYLWFPDLRDYYGDHFLGDSLLATLYSDADVIGKASFYGAKASGGTLSLNAPGKEFRWRPSVSPGSMIAKAAALDSEQRRALLKGRSLPGSKLKILSVDRYNYVKDGGETEGARKVFRTALL
jgi:hypothetical protein